MTGNYLKSTNNKLYLFPCFNLSNQLLFSYQYLHWNDDNKQKLVSHEESKHFIDFVS